MVRQILGTAGDKACDLIVMGTHGKTGAQQVMLGSVAAEVCRKASCPVLTVKLPAPQGAAAAPPLPELAGQAR